MIARVMLICTVISFSACGQPEKIANKLRDAFDEAIVELEQTNDNFEQMNAQLDDANEQLTLANVTFGKMGLTLEDLKGKLDDGEYKNQVDDLIGRAAQMSQVSVQGSVDFTCDRLVNELNDLKQQIMGGAPVKRKPVLSNPQSPRIDFKSNSRSTLSIVGWNLEVAQSNPTKFRVVVESDDGRTRIVDPKYIGYQGSYLVTLNVASDGIPLNYGDKKLILEGYSNPFEIVIINSVKPKKKIILPPPKRDPKFDESETTGGSGGVAFSDKTSKKGKVTKVIIQHAGRVESIQIVIDGKAQTRHGNQNNQERFSEFTLGKDEYITGISGVSNNGSQNRINAIKIHTNERKSELFGGNAKTNFTIEAPKGYEVIGFHGRAAGEVDAIGIISRERM